jgi:hypothetical protein
MPAHDGVAAHAGGTGVRKPQGGNRGGMARPCVRRYGYFGVGGLSMNAGVGSDQGDDGTRLAGCDRQSRRRRREIEPHDGYRGRCEIAPDHCRSGFGKAEMQPFQRAASKIAAIQVEQIERHQRSDGCIRPLLAMGGQAAGKFADDSGRAISGRHGARSRGPARPRRREPGRSTRTRSRMMNAWRGPLAFTHWCRHRR